uniref:NAC domain-containing protein 100-like n=1 Tax=Fragaria vesca subsp. vesca TaxID=101020 RepID=UPI0005C90F11|nr:PREDICTED: NAC domain-containing protein 100-like [Fragaria vesca subsp. vesca]
MASSSCVSGFNLPSGFNFLPTDLELLGYYLLNKVLGKPFKYDSRVMIELNLYKEEPWDLWNRFGARLNHGEDLYIFTELKKKSNNGSNVSRTTGSGTWKGDTAEAKVSEDKKILGSWKRFRYVPNEPNETGSWIMVEYKLDDSLNPKSCRGRDLVLSRIRKDRKRKLIEDQMNDTIQCPCTKVARVEETNDVKSTYGIRPILNDDTNLPASFTQCLASEEEQQLQQQEELDSNKMLEKQQDPQLIVQPSPNAVISHQPNNLGIPYFHDQQQQLLGDVLTVSNNHDNFQVNDREHESYVMSTYENQILNEDNNTMASCFTRWLSSDDEEQQQPQQEVQPNKMCEGQQSSVSFEHVEQQLQQEDQQLLPSTSHDHERQQILGNHLMGSRDNEPQNARPHPDSLTSQEPNHFDIPTEIDEGQFNHYFTVNELFSDELSDSAALKFSSLDDDVFNGIDLTAIGR